MITVGEIKEELQKMNLESVSGIESDLEFILWDYKDLDELNMNYEVQEYHKGHFAIGSNGGFEMLTVELASGIVYRIPFISNDNSDKIIVSNSLSELIKIK